MKKLYVLTFVFAIFSFWANAQLTISEISYNPPESGSDSLEYIEFYNPGTQAVDLTGYSLTQGVDYDFPSMMLDPGAYFVIAINPSAMMNVFGVSTEAWTNGALSNGGEDIVVVDGNGTVIDSVDYENSGDWPGFDQGTNGAGASIEFCMDTDDNGSGLNWRASSQGTGVVINDNEVKGTPGAANSAVCEVVPDHTIVASGLEFTPMDITINQGETVRWENTNGVHNVNGQQSDYPNNPEGFYSGEPAPAPWTFDFTFNALGTYDYQCDLHVGQGMVGTVTVVSNEPPAALVITEIMYNDPKDPDSLDFIEVYNNGDSDANLMGYYFSGVDFTFPEMTLAAGEYAIVSANSMKFMELFGVSSMQYDGSLENGGETIQIFTSLDEMVDEVSYQNSAPWPDADGNGYSINLCNTNADNSMPESWTRATTDAGFSYGGSQIFANPGNAATCQLTIAEATVVGSQNEALLSGQEVTLQGVVYGINYRPNGLQFFIIDENNDGIAVFNNSGDLGYATVTEGDELRIFGTIDQFNGLIQIEPMTIDLISSGNALFDPTVVTSLDESTESQLIQMTDVQLVDPAQWTNSTPGFNVEVTNGTDVVEIRIDADTDMFGMEYPTGTFTVTGMGGQFDNSSPFDEGYQILPRYLSDIDPYVPFESAYPAYSIALVTTNDADGKADSLTTTCQLTGTVYGINLRPSGLQFTIIDDNNDGIHVFNLTGDLGYTPTEGDNITIQGIIDQFNGLTQIEPDNIVLNSSGNSLVDPTVVTELNEDSESQLVTIEGVSFDNPGDWEGDGSSFNIAVSDGEGNQFTLRIDRNVDLADMPIPEGSTFNITGIGGQFDQESPFDSGYQLFPRYATDIDMVNSTIDLEDGSSIKFYPNPTSGVLNIESDETFDFVNILDVNGRLIGQWNVNSQRLNVSELNNGVYFIQLKNEGRIYSTRFIKI